MSENYFYSSLTADEIETRLVGGVLFNVNQELSSSQKAIARANIGAGTENTGFQILGYYDSLEDLQESLLVLPQPGDAYGIGIEPPYEIYIYDGSTNTWLDNGTLNINAIIDDGAENDNSTWSSSKIDNAKQDKITVSGVLKGNGSGVVSSATLGTDYGSLCFPVMLLASSWSNGSQTVTNSNFITSGFAYIVSPAGSSREEYLLCGIYANDVTINNLMSFNCMSAPSSDLVVNVLRMVSA